MKLSIKTTWHLKNHWNISFRLKFQDKLFNGMFVLGWLFESKQSAIASSTFTDANDNKATCSSSAKSTHSPSKFISVDSHVDSTLGGIPFRGSHGIECFIIYYRSVCLCVWLCEREWTFHAAWMRKWKWIFDYFPSELSTIWHIAKKLMNNWCDFKWFRVLSHCRWCDALCACEWCD